MKMLLPPLFLFLSISVYSQTLIQRTSSINVDYSSHEGLGNEVSIASGIPKYRALIMGVSSYKNEGPGLSSLENPVRDAQQVYSLLTTHYGFEPSDVIFLKDPTRQEIIDAFDKLSNETSSNDNVLVFYAGHGIWDRQRELGYWLPSDAEVKSRSAWIANSQIKDYLSDNAIRSKHTLLITDACFGGSIFKSRSVSAEGLMRINELYKEPSRKAMTSGNLSAVPDRSVFTQQLLKKLNDNTDEYLPAQQLFTRMYEPIVNNASTNPVYGIIRGGGGGGGGGGDGGGDFIFIRRAQ